MVIISSPYVIILSAAERQELTLRAHAARAAHRDAIRARIVLAAADDAIRRTGIALALLSMVVSHGVSFATNYVGGGEYRRVSLKQVVTAPYRRVAVLHLAILVGALALLALGSPMFGLIGLVLLKTGMDVVAHRAERQRLARVP